MKREQPRKRARVKGTASDHARAAAPTKQEVSVTAAKGRPMLTWVGKRPLRRVTAFPAQLVETFNPLREESQGQNLLFQGDNKEVLAWLLANGYRGKVGLIYIDPPFDSGADYVRKVQLRGVAGVSRIDGESYTLGEQIQYTDIWANDNYLQFMYERLLILRELLIREGSFFLHCDWKRSHLLRCLLDEVFGAENFRNEIIRVKCNPKNSERRAYGNIHDCVLYYVKGDAEARTWNPQRESPDSEDLSRLFEKVDGQGRRYTTVALHARGERRGETGRPWRGIPPPPGRHWAYVHTQLDRFDAEGRLEWSESGNPRLIRYADEKEGDLVQDIWTMKDPQEDEYPTEKPEELLTRIVAGSTKSGDLVLDCFLGSGTTAAAAQKLGRRWIGCDINKGAIQTTVKRLQTVIEEQIAAERQGRLPGADAADRVKPAALSFSVYRVNDYDLAIQHNEAVQLACEHLGVERTRTDAYFDGTLGKRLVKIVPFGHPLTLLDLDELERELKSRPKEDRDVVLVCLGKEPAVDDWLANRNRHRPVNKIEVVELRTDKKYGKFFTHQPARARVEIKRAQDKVLVEIKDFISPTILERLSMDQTLFKAQITDWRAMVDSVTIDPDHDGKVFNVALADVPERKTDLVAGRYELPAPTGSATVAVKITDMLGEEVLVSRVV